jgi:hypothetical protein
MSNRKGKAVLTTRSGRRIFAPPPPVEINIRKLRDKIDEVRKRREGETSANAI